MEWIHPFVVECAVHLLYTCSTELYTFRVLFNLKTTGAHYSHLAYVSSLDRLLSLISIPLTSSFVTQGEVNSRSKPCVIVAEHSFYQGKNERQHRVYDCITPLKFQMTDVVFIRP